MKINRTTQRAVDILKIVSVTSEGLTLEEICKQLNMPKTSAYDIVVTLAHMNMLELIKSNKNRYRIGLSAYRIGMNYSNHRDIAEVIDPELKALAGELGKTVFFGIRNGIDIVYMSKSEPENPIITTATVGTKNPVYCTSLGKAILAFEPSDVAEEVLSDIEYKPNTEYTLKNSQSFRHEMELIRQRGYAFDARELEDHMECVGAPIFNQDGKVVGAISASSLYKPTEDYDALGSKVSAKAMEISKLLGFDEKS